MESKQPLLRDYILVLAEKPKAAAKIANALGISEKRYEYRVPYWVGRVGSKLVVVTATAGHLFTLSTEVGGYPVFSYKWVPRWLEDRDAKHLVNYFKILKKLFKYASEYVNACDYDVEGSVIGYLIISHFGDLRRAKRMKFSSLTTEELRKAFNDLRPLDWEMIEAGLCRHELDWMWGINVSRALSDIFKVIYGRRLILSAGRVQSPTLVEVFNNHVARETFVPDIFFTVSVKVGVQGKYYTLENLFKPLDRLDAAKALAHEIRKNSYLEVSDAVTSTESVSPPPPFNLPDLQFEASRIYGYSPAKVLSIAEGLYLDSLISYPRTNSQKLPKDLNNRAIISSIARISKYHELAAELLKKTYLRPVEGEKEDPAHPAIYPTGYPPPENIKLDSLRIYDLIVRRYLASFADELRIKRVKYYFTYNAYRFLLSGAYVLNRGWLNYYPFYATPHVQLPQLNVGDRVEVVDVKVIHVYTKPVPKYSKTSLLKWMESVGIGTEATRAEIIETLFKRGYLMSSSKYVKVSELGLQVVRVLQRFFSDLTSVELTRKFEELMREIVLGKAVRASVISEAKEVLQSKLANFKEVVRGCSKDDLLRMVGLGYSNMKCSICGGYGGYYIDGMRLCELHYKALMNVKNMYEVWRSKLGIKWNDYLVALNKLKSVGSYCRDVIDVMLKSSMHHHKSSI